MTMRDAARPLATVSPSPIPLLTGSVDANPHAVQHVRRAVGRFARSHGAEGELLGLIELAVSEAVANVVQHAYRPGDHGLIHVAADVEEGTLEIVVGDDGHGFRSGETEGQGLGLPAIAGITADFAISQRIPQGTEVWMRFFLPA